jgi:hypothetical protein
MHRQFARAYYYQSLPQNDPDVDSQDEDEEHQSFCAALRKKLPDTEGDRFNIGVGVIITINAIVLGLETDWGQEKFLIFEHIFGVFFTSEMLMRISQLGIGGYIRKGSNSFDCLLVCTGDFDLWISPFLSHGKTTKGSGTAKAMKLLRMFRVMRIIRLFKMFRELQIILEAFVKALNTVMWVGLLTLIINYVFAVFITQTIGKNASLWEDDTLLIEQWFGTIGNSMRTLFIIITLAQWDQIALVVSHKVNGLAVFCVAIGYITLTAFTMVSLITGIISEELVGAQKDDDEHKLEQVEKGKLELAEHVKTLLQSFDEDGNGSLSELEVRQALDNKDLKLMEHLQALTINMEMEDFLSMISRLKTAHATDEIPIDDIAASLEHLSGTASASSIWDLKMMALRLRADCDRVNGNVDQIPKQLDTIRDDVSTTVSRTDAFIRKLDETDELMQSQESLINNRLETLKGRLDTLVGSYTSEKADGDKVQERLGKIDQLMQSMTCHLKGESTSKGQLEGKEVYSPSVPVESIPVQSILGVAEEPGLLTNEVDAAIPQLG